MLRSFILARFAIMSESFISYKILPENGLILNNFQYKVQIRDLISLTLKFMEDPLYNSEYNLLMDFRDSMAIVFRMELSDYLDFFKKSVRLKKKVKIAILYTSPNHEFLIKVYKPMAKLFKMDVEKFKNINDAMLWLELPIQVFDSINLQLKEIKYQQNRDI